MAGQNSGSKGRQDEFKISFTYNGDSNNEANGEKNYGSNTASSREFKDLDFSSKFNVVYGENGSGKTTIARFFRILGDKIDFGRDILEDTKDFSSISFVSSVKQSDAQNNEEYTKKVEQKFGKFFVFDREFRDHALSLLDKRESSKYILLSVLQLRNTVQASKTVVTQLDALRGIYSIGENVYDRIFKKFEDRSNRCMEYLQDAELKAKRKEDTFLLCIIEKEIINTISNSIWINTIRKGFLIYITFSTFL